MMKNLYRGLTALRTNFLTSSFRPDGPDFARNCLSSHPWPPFNFASNFFLTLKTHMSFDLLHISMNLYTKMNIFSRAISWWNFFFKYLMFLQIFFKLSYFSFRVFPRKTRNLPTPSYFFKKSSLRSFISYIHFIYWYIV